MFYCGLFMHCVYCSCFSLWFHCCVYRAMKPARRTVFIIGSMIIIIISIMMMMSNMSMISIITCIMMYYVITASMIITSLFSISIIVGLVTQLLLCFILCHVVSVEQPTIGAKYCTPENQHLRNNRYFYYY